MVAGQAAQVGIAVSSKIKKGGSELSLDIFNYDFVNLIVKLFVFFSFAWIAKAVVDVFLGASGIANTVIAFFVPEERIPRVFPKRFVDFMKFGINGITYWDIVKFVAILIVILEYRNWANTQKKLGLTKSPATIATFGVIIIFLGFITIPELIQRIKEGRILKEGIVNG